MGHCHPQLSLLMFDVDIQLLMGKEISKTFPDRRGSVKWEEM